MLEPIPIFISILCDLSDVLHVAFRLYDYESTSVLSQRVMYLHFYFSALTFQFPSDNQMNSKPYKLPILVVVFVILRFPSLYKLLLLYHCKQQVLVWPGKIITFTSGAPPHGTPRAFFTPHLSTDSSLVWPRGWTLEYL